MNIMNTGELAKLVDGVVEGDSGLEITGLSGIATAEPGDLTFAVDEDRLSNAERSAASCVLTNRSIRRSTKTLIRVKDPKLSFVIVFNLFNVPGPGMSFMHPTAIVHSAARLGRNVWVGPRVTIGEGVTVGDNVTIEDNAVIKRNCAIGSFCHIYPNVTLYENVKLHERVVLHGGVVVGSDGFGYVKDKGKIYKFPQLGAVILGADVEVGANTTIDRGSLSDTVIGAGTKIDNLCQIAHNVRIGKNVLMAAQCGISGSTTVGDNVTMGGQTGVIDNVVIGDNVTIGAKSAVIGSVKENSVVWGVPARPIVQAKRQMAVLSWITKNFKTMRQRSRD